MAQTPAPNSMEAIYYADIELPETVARNLYRRGQELETVNAALLAALEAMLNAFSLETAMGVDASMVRCAAKKQARAAVAFAKQAP